jgi:hypothetical protein
MGGMHACSRKHKQEMTLETMVYDEGDDLDPLLRGTGSGGGAADVANGAET